MLGYRNLSSAPRRSLRKLRIASVSLVLGAAVLAATAGSVLAWGVSDFSTPDEQLLFALTNQDRASAGLTALVNDNFLHNKAEWRSQDMGDRGYFSHQIPPDNKTVFSYLQGYCFRVAGENIGMSTYGDDVATTRIEAAFMSSTTHRANILGSWVRMGVGAYKAADGQKYWTVLFSVPCSAPVITPAPVKPKATPRPVVTIAPTPTPTPTETPTPTPTATPTETPTPTPTPTPTATAAPTLAPLDQHQLGAALGSGKVTSLRVHVRADSQGPFDSFFHSLFGGLFGW